MLIIRKPRCVQRASIGNAWLERKLLYPAPCARQSFWQEDLLRKVADGLDVMAVRVEHERAVVVRVVMRA